MKTKETRGGAVNRRRTRKPSLSLRHPALILFLCAATLAPAAAQKRPKPALKDSEARRAVASAPGFALNTAVVKVRGVSAAGETPVVVTAEVELAVLLRRVEGEPGSGDAAGWRAEEFRTGDRSWERFEWLAGALDHRQLEGARVALQSLALEYETKQRERAGGSAVDGGAAGGGQVDGEQAVGTQEKGGREKGDAAKAAEPLEVRRGPLRMTELSPISSSARAVVFVEASFELERGADRKWRVAAVRVGEEVVRDLGAVFASAGRLKAERARAELGAVRAALEAFRAERGFYVVSDDYVVLIDHLSPRYLPHVIRIDPWSRPYRYEGTRDGFRLRSDGADGEPDTPDDITPGG